jgi:hypothetical protein
MINIVIWIGQNEEIWFYCSVVYLMEFSVVIIYFMRNIFFMVSSDVEDTSKEFLRPSV